MGACMLVYRVRVCIMTAQSVLQQPQRIRMGSERLSALTMLSICCQPAKQEASEYYDPPQKSRGCACVMFVHVVLCVRYLYCRTLFVLPNVCVFFYFHTNKIAHALKYFIIQRRRRHFVSVQTQQCLSQL